MSFQKIKQLVLVDLLQTNRQMNTSGKKIEPKNIVFRLLLQNGLILGSFAIIFGSILANVPFIGFPGIFSNMLNTIAIFSSLQFFQFVFTLFYEDEDLSTYLALPFSGKELFLSKAISLLLTSFSFFTFPILLITMLGKQTGLNIVFSLFAATFSTLLIYLVIILGVFFLLHLLNQLEIFRKHKRIFSIVVYVALTIFVFLMIYSQSYSSSTADMNVQDQKINYLFVGFHEIFIAGSRFAGLWKIGIWTALLVFLLWYTNRKIIPQLFTNSHETLTRTVKRSKSKNTGLEFAYTNSHIRNFLNYQLRQLQDASFIMQMIFSKFYMPFVFIAPFIFGNDDISELLSWNQLTNIWGLFILIGLFLSALLIDTNSISGVIISLDQENYYYIQSMPFSFKHYLKLKYYFAFFVEWILGFLPLVFILFFIKMNLVLSLSILFGYSIGTYVMSIRYFKRDYNKLYLNWSNFQDLAKRGINQGLKIFLLMISMFIIIFLFGIFFYYVTVSLSDHMKYIFSIIMTIFLPLATYFYYANNEKTFWKRFN